MSEINYYNIAKELDYATDSRDMYTSPAEYIAMALECLRNNPSALSMLLEGTGYTKGYWRKWQDMSVVEISADNKSVNEYLHQIEEQLAAKDKDNCILHGRLHEASIKFKKMDAEIAELKELYKKQEIGWQADVVHFNEQLATAQRRIGELTEENRQLNLDKCRLDWIELELQAMTKVPYRDAIDAEIREYQKRNPTLLTPKASDNEQTASGKQEEAK